MTAPHYFTADVEEYFQVSAFERYVRREQWEELPSRLAGGVGTLLDLLARRGGRGTFFVLGWVARHRPDVVRLIADAGHEVASHGYSHQRVTTLTPEAFRRDVATSKAVLEDLTGMPVLGYRAPSFSIVPGREWALDILLEEGYRYDSSLFPVRRSGYGYPGVPHDPFVVVRRGGELLEFPPGTVGWSGLRIPAGGGGWFRQFPYELTRRALRSAEQRGAAGTFYIHPWEVDPAQPRMAVPLLTRVRHYRGIHRTGPRLERLLAEFAFIAIGDRLGDFGDRADPALERVVLA